MVHITEMRVPLPMTVEEFRRGQRYANWKTNEANTTEGQGGQLVSSAPYVNEIWGQGFFTHSLFRLGDRLPDWVTKLVPSSALVIDEKTWMAYPHIRSVLTVPFFHKLKIEMISVHENDDGTSENILGLSEAELAIRKVDVVDIAFDKVQKRDYQAKLDPQLVVSKKTGRGPLESGWQSTEVPMMCAYKLVRVEANYWGVQNRLEKLMLNGVRQIILLTHRNAFGFIDEWYDMTLEEIQALEFEGRERLKAVVKQPPIIDPNTGLEFVVDSSGEISKGSETVNSDESDADLEFFEATMEWTTQEAEEFGESLLSGVSAPPLNWKLPSASLRCAVCEARTKTSTEAQVICDTCKEFFCHKCFSEFHITPRLKDHIRHYKTASTVGAPRRENSVERSGALLRERRIDQYVSSSSPTELNSPLIDDGSTRKSIPERAQQVPLTKYVESKLAHQRDPSWLEELNTSTEGVQSSPAQPSSKTKIKSNYKVLNSQASSNLENGQESTSVSSSRLGPERTLSRKKSSVRPNELAEEMVRSMASLYQTRSDSLFPSSPNHSPMQCLPQVRNRSRSQSFVDLAGAEQQPEKLIGETVLDPYGVQELLDTGVYSKSVAVTSTPEMEMIKDSDLYKHVRALVELLQNVDPRDMTHEQRLAFWINLYNSLMMHAYIVRGIPRSHYKRIALMHKSAYIVGGHLFSALAIEHAILRACSYRPALASLLPVHKYKKHDARQAYALDRPEPLVSFALCCGSYSSPMVRVYTAGGIQTELKEACRDFLTASVGMTRHSRVMIPKIMHWYARDFSNDARSLLEWIALQLPDERRAPVQECLDKKRGKKTSQQMSIVSYDWTFRYLFKRTPDS
ncbi:unnamed protein product [Calypogeia fissa]